MFYVLVTLLSFALPYLAFLFGLRTGFSTLRVMLGHSVSSGRYFLTLLIVIGLSASIYFSNTITVTSETVDVSGKKFPTIYIIGYLICLNIPAFIGYFLMRARIRKLRLEEMMTIYANTNGLTVTFNQLKESIAPNIHALKKKDFKLLSQNNELQEYRDAYEMLRTDLMPIRELHLGLVGNPYSAIDLVDQNFVALNNQLGLATFLLNDFTGAEQIYLQNYSVIEGKPQTIPVNLYYSTIIGIAYTHRYLKKDASQYINKFKMHLESMGAMEQIESLNEQLALIKKIRVT